MRLSGTFVGTVLGLIGCLITPVRGAVTPEQKCQASKHLLVGKHAHCLQRAEGKLAITGNVTNYAKAVEKCETVFARNWQRIVDKAAAKGATCPDAPLTDLEFGTVVEGHSQKIATALAGGGFGDCHADLATCEIALPICEGDLAACNADLASCTLSCPTASLVATGVNSCHDDSGAPIACAGTGQDGELRLGRPQAYIDNGDGTITDLSTGLMWEKLSDDGSIHDKDNTYVWDDALGTRMAALNNGGGFAGYSDWRVPNVVELASLIDYGGANVPLIDRIFNTGCTPGCAVTTCSCTGATDEGPGILTIYWTSSSFPAIPANARKVEFNDYGNLTAIVHPSPKTAKWLVRAVRGGL